MDLFLNKSFTKFSYKKAFLAILEGQKFLVPSGPTIVAPSLDTVTMAPPSECYLFTDDKYKK